MAATLTDSGELTYLSFGIDKVESTPDGDLLCFGRASDGSLDHDQQIVDPQFSSKAIRDWLESGGNVRVQHNAQRDPAGVGLEVNTDADGATWVKSLIIEPVAKKLLAAGALRAYSVGIARPTIVRDAVAKGGRITDGSICEISLVDRPANARCGVQLVKSADDGTPEYVGKVFGGDDDIAKALDGEVAEKSAAPAEAPEAARFGFTEDLSVTFTPSDLARLMKQKFVQQHYDELAAQAVAEKRDFDPGVGGGVDRDKLPASSFAGPHRSFPVVNQSDVSDAMHLAGHASDPDQVRANIKRIANREGFSVPDDSDSKSKGAEEAVEQVVEKAEPEAAAEPVTEKEAEPDVTKDPEPDEKPKPVKKAKKPKKMPPWLNKPKDGDDDSDDDDGSCKMDHAHTEKCHTDPAQAAGVSASPMTPAPVGELMETPAPDACKADAEPAVEEAPTRLEAAMKGADPEVAALLRFKALGVDEDLGRLHDLTCPAYHPADVAKHHPLADLPGLINSGAWQKKTLAAAAGPLDHAQEMHKIWQAALLLKTADMADLNDWRLELYKAFRDANPGPGSYPTPGMVSPQRYNRPVLTDGRPANGVDYAGPNSAPQVASGPPNAQHFDRPPLGSTQESPSPSFMKGGGGEYPSEQGVPMQLTYAQMQKEQTRMALVRMHDHLSRQFPEVCPLNTADSRPLRGVQPENHPVPPTAGIGKAADPEPVQAAPVAAAFKATPEDDTDMFADADVYKSFKKMRKKLGKKVLSGKMTVDEARARMGRTFAQKGADEAAGEPQETAQKSAAVPNIFQTDPEYRQRLEARGAVIDDNGVMHKWPDPEPSASPEVIKAAVAEATSELKELLVKQQETFTTKLAEQQKVIDAIADQPDPSTAAFSGLAFQPVQKSRRPAAVPDQVEYAARAQAMIRRNLQHTYETHSDPHVREAASGALANLGAGMEAPPMT